jgi:hypothetical protein
MKRRNFQRAIGITGMVLGLVIGADVASAEDFGNPEIVQPNSNEFGNAYGEWSARWWQWLLSIPDAKNPNLDRTGANCADGQTGQVWFLAGTFGGSARRSCTIPAGRDLFFPALNELFGQGLGDCTGPDDCDVTALRKLAATKADDPKSLEVTIDGIRVAKLDQYRVTSPAFNVFLPQGAIFSLPNGTIGPVVSDGYWLLLAPLSRGQHIIHFKSVDNSGLTIDVTYTLTVKG